VRSFEQPPEQRRLDLSGHEVTHVAPFGDCPVDTGALGSGEGVLAHGRNSAAAASGAEGR